MTKKHHGPEGPNGLDRPLDPFRPDEPGSAAPDRQRPDGTDQQHGGAGGSGGLGGSDGPGGDPIDEEGLRRLLHTVVDDIEPSRDALDHLRRAVPARRARKRQALVGAAAAVLLVGASVPALLHVAQADSVTANPANAGHSEHAQDSGGSDADGADGRKDRQRSGKASKGGKKDGTDGAKGDSSRKPDGSAAGGANPSDKAAIAAPTCTREQLGGGSASSTSMDGTNTVYASFSVSNISGTACTINDGGLVAATVQGADSSAVQVVDHTQGDAATGLPDPASQPSQLVLQPGQPYVVKFAWIPAREGSGGCQPAEASPDPTTSGSTDPQAAPVSETSGENPPATSGSVVLTYTPQGVEPVAASTTITNVCAGTIYTTGALPGS